MQTILRAQAVFRDEVKFWNDMFLSISVEYFGSRFVEMAVLGPELDRRLTHIDKASRKKLIYLLSYNGDEVITQVVFNKIMRN